MKVNDILTEDSTPALNAYKSYNSGAVSPLQLALLKKISVGRFDPLSMSPNTEAAADVLMDLGLIDSAYGLTTSGQKVMSIAARKVNPMTADISRKAELRRAITRKERPEPVDVDVELDADDFMGEPEADDVDMGGTLRAERKVKKNSVKALDRDDFSSFDKDSLVDDDGEYNWKD